MRPLRFAAVLTVAGLIALPQAALARPGDTQCLWQHMPPATLKAFVEGAKGDEVPALEDFLSNSDVYTALKACKIEDTEARLAGQAFGGLAIQRMSEFEMYKASGVTVAELDKAWARIDAADLKLLGEGLMADDLPPGYQEALDRVVATITAAQSKPPPDLWLRRYIVSRAAVPVIEASF